MSDTLATLIEQRLLEGGRFPIITDRQSDVLESLPKPLANSALIKQFLNSIACRAPYLARLMADEVLLSQILLSAPQECLREIHIAIDVLIQRVSLDKETLSREMRRLKNRAALLLALSDLGNIWDDVMIMEALSEFADHMCALSFKRAFDFLPPKMLSAIDWEAVRQGHTGLCVLAMGKHGAHELNYSSDIDLIVFFDALYLPIAKTAEGAKLREDPKSLAVKVTQIAAALLQDQTADGYVFRVDLRLRPDPGSSAVAVSLDVAENYYEMFGQNWERAAFIKARPVAGDERLYPVVMSMMQPFIWRRYLDFATIEDVHAIKRQIHAVKGGGDIAFAGHDVKLGRGGIREIEFYVQTQQLILGGRDPELRNTKTLDALAALSRAGHVDVTVAADLTKIYLYLRHIEHRIQMINDEQTHHLPKDPEKLDLFAAFCGYETTKEFQLEFVSTCNVVHGHYADLFEEHDALSLQGSNLVFTGVEDDPATLTALENMRFQDPPKVTATVRQWHAGGMRATRTVRGRELLTKLVPAILHYISAAETPDKVFQYFDRFLRDMPSGVQVFSLFLSQPDVLEQVIKLIALSPRLAGEMAYRKRFIEALFEQAASDPERQDSYGLQELKGHLLKISQSDVTFEDALNQIRSEVSETRFLVATDLVLNKRSPVLTGRALSLIADETITALIPIARKEIERLHGKIKGGLVVIGMGRLGATTLTVASDLDLVFVYETQHDELSTAPEGPTNIRSIDGVTYFTRFVRRLVTALSAQTHEGGLYEIDMALRPSGGAGPAAVSFSAFRDYYANHAWIWEKMALTKARVVTGDADLKEKVDLYIDKILIEKRDLASIKAGVVDMRERLLEAKPACSIWDVKRVWGGLTDVEFICQYLCLIHASETTQGRYPENFQESFKLLESQKHISRQCMILLLEAAAMYEKVLHFTRAVFEGFQSPAELDSLQQQAFLAYLDQESLEACEAELQQHVQRVQDVFRDIIGRPRGAS